MNTVKLFNVNDFAVLRTFTHHTAAVRCLALLPDGLRFVCGDEDNNVSNRLPRPRAAASERTSALYITA